MIISHLQYLQQEGCLLPKAIQKGLAYLQTTDLQALPPGKYTLAGEDIFVSIDEYKTQPKSERRAEAHRQYLDIQYIISGTEVIAHELLNAESEITENLTPSQDVVFYRPGLRETDIVMTAGMYAVFFPWDIHRPCCKVKEESIVKKAVVKIKMDILYGTSINRI